MVVVTIAHVTGIEAGLWIKAGGDHFAEDGISLLPELLVVVRFHMLFEIATMRQIRNKSKHFKNDSLTVRKSLDIPDITVLRIADWTHMFVVLTVCQNGRHGSGINVQLGLFVGKLVTTRKGRSRGSGP